MKTIASFLLSLALFTPLFARADGGFVPFTDLDTYIKTAKQIFIGECVPIDETNYNAFVYVRKIRVISVLQGTCNPSNEVTVLAPMTLPSPLVGHYYLICGKENNNERLNLFSLGGLPDTEIHLWGEAKSQKEYMLSMFLKELEGKTIKEKLMILIKKRQDDLKKEQENIKSEIDTIDTMLKSAGETGNKN